MAPNRGKLIVVEGLDRAGKSTQVDLLLTSLTQQGHAVEKLRFPDRSTAIGQSIDSYLKTQADSNTETTAVNDQAIHLLFSANRWECLSKIQTALSAGTNLIIDRYSFSGAVYSAAKATPGLDLDWAWSMEIGLPKPDVVLFLQVAEEVQVARGGFGLERYESLKMQRAVRKGFEALWKRYQGWVEIVDAAGSVEEVQGLIMGVVDGMFEDGTEMALETLTALR